MEAVDCGWWWRFPPFTFACKDAGVGKADRRTRGTEFASVDSVRVAEAINAGVTRVTSGTIRRIVERMPGAMGWSLSSWNRADSTAVRTLIPIC